MNHDIAQASNTNNMMAYKIKKRMEQLGINARELAEKANVGKSFVYDILNGKSKNPTSKKLDLISKELGISISYLISGSADSIDYENFLPVYSLEGEQKTNLLINRAFSSFHVGMNDKLWCYNMYDDSMSPTIVQNELLILNNFTNNKQVTKSGIFLIKDELDSVIRRVEHIFGTKDVKIIPDNERYSTYIRHFDEIEIVGKVLFSIRRF